MLFLRRHVNINFLNHKIQFWVRNSPYCLLHAKKPVVHSIVTTGFRLIEPALASPHSKLCHYGCIAA